MNAFHFDNKTFALVANSANGQVDTSTVFKYRQNGDLVTADYYGGTIRYGKIVALLTDNQLDMRYQCLSTDNELKAGKAIATISKNEVGKLLLQLNWQWLDEEKKTGTSTYIEIG